MATRRRGARESRRRAGGRPPAAWSRWRRRARGQAASTRARRRRPRQRTARARAAAAGTARGAPAPQPRRGARRAPRAVQASPPPRPAAPRRRAAPPARARPPPRARPRASAPRPRRAATPRARRRGAAAQARPWGRGWPGRRQHGSGWDVADGGGGRARGAARLLELDEQLGQLVQRQQLLPALEVAGGAVLVDGGRGLAQPRQELRGELEQARQRGTRRLARRRQVSPHGGQDAVEAAQPEVDELRLEVHQREGALLDPLSRHGAALEAEGRAVVDGAAVEHMARREHHRLAHQRKHNGVAKVLGRLIQLAPQHIGELRQHVGPSALGDLQSDCDLALDGPAWLAEQPRAGSIDVRHVDLLVLPPQALHVGKLQAEREQGSEVLVQRLQVQRVRRRGGHSCPEISGRGGLHGTPIRRSQGAHSA